MEIKTRDIIETVVYIFLGYIIAIGAHAGLAYALGTDYPVVAVVSSSMEHHNEATYYDWFIQNNFTEEEMGDWNFQWGMQKGDIVAVQGIKFEDIQIGDVIVYQLPGEEPIIHRVVKIEEDKLYTKGDNNLGVDPTPLQGGYVKGKALIHIPLLGYVKIAYMSLVGGL